jgi:hypothetical protein
MPLDTSMPHMAVCDRPVDADARDRTELAEASQGDASALPGRMDPGIPGRQPCSPRSRVAATGPRAGAPGITFGSVTPYAPGAAGEAQDGCPRDPAVAEPPFATGDTVIFPDAPELGAMTVERIRPYSDGMGYEVFWTGPHGASGRCPEWRLARTPDGFTDPPPMPAGSVRYGLSEAARQDAKARDDADPEHQWRLCSWRARMINGERQ